MRDRVSGFGKCSFHRHGTIDFAEWEHVAKKPQRLKGIEIGAVILVAARALTAYWLGIRSGNMNHFQPGSLFQTLID
ncbi:hypothetical protein RX327_12150 [Bradyrhizobium sp. BEA-2-5]|uniref:hypothetical protein n=1 Tax=Bradyrhizobium TaxID=374 RepID=UPI00067E5709|nr:MULTISPECIES: hypothetical protein [Bradyrhizobium]WOH83823.1 hypothetical protein RX327_12150 [Bradyrhizobium sp. BEA-2-5]